MRIIDNFLSENDCDFLIDYHKGFHTLDNYDSQFLVHMKDTPLYNLRKSWIRYWYLRRIRKDFSLKLNYDQIVHWPPNSDKMMHKDGSFKENNDRSCVCYLNDDFEGGETLIEDKSIKPKKGTLVVFPSKKMSHGVSLVKSNRYTYIAWWEETCK